MWKLAIFTLALSQFTWATSVEISNFNFNYTDPKGEGTADVFRHSALREEAVHVAAEKIDEAFKLTVTGSENTELTVKDLPDFVKKAKTMALSNFNLSFQDQFDVSLDEAQFDSDKSSLDMVNFSLSCAKDSKAEKVMDQLLSGCVQRMSLKSSKFSSGSVQQEAFHILAASLSSLAGERGGDVLIRGLDLHTDNGKYNLSAEVKAQISGTARSSGSMSYDAASGKFTLKINEVKFGLFNVTGQVFSELKKNQNDKLKVSEPYVYIQLK